MNRIDIGFVEECESWRLESRFFPSKVGRKPAWLNLKDLPNCDAVSCEMCKNPCVFLCQIYAPREDDTRAFHRTLYVFVCKNETCHEPNGNGSLKVLRSQLPRENIFYPFEPPEEHENWRTDIRAEKWSKTCRVCGILAPRHCARCKFASYCCRDHQVRDWKVVHQQQCNADLADRSGTIATAAGFNDLLFPEFEIVMESEDKIELENGEDNTARETEEMERFESLVKSGRAGTLQSEKDVDIDLRSMSQAENDETFANFSEKVKEHPDQVLRYDRGGTPLYISTIVQPLNVPNCEECNSPRHFEFQIMPQLLNYLGFDDVLKSLDWGTLLIFTCLNSCVPKSGYAPEYIWKQDIVEVTSEAVSKSNCKIFVSNNVNYTYQNTGGGMLGVWDLRKQAFLNCMIV